MARYLALDWSQQQLLVVSATVRGGQVQIKQAAAWQEENAPAPENAEQLGRLLRERLKQAGIAPAPVLACVGRDRVILKDIRYPAVPAQEEPAIVRFQAVKELTGSPEESVIDYIPRAGEGETAERKALVVIAKRDLVESYRTLCQAAGLKLEALTPRPWGTAACWRQAMKTGQLSETAGVAVALLTVTRHWGEFCVTRDGDLLFTRPMGAAADKEAALLGEIRRNLTVYASQSPQYPVRALGVAAGPAEEVLRERLQNSLAVPVHAFDPLSGVSAPSVTPDLHGGFAAAVGLLHALAENRALPVNLVAPKQPRPPRDPNKRRALFATAAAASLLLIGVAWGATEVMRRDRELASLSLAKIDLDNQLALVEEDAKRIKTMSDWVDGEVIWLDELYDLADRVPDLATLQMTQLVGQPLPRTGKDTHVGRLVLKGVTVADNRPADAFSSQLVQDQFYRVDALVKSRNTGTDRFRGFPLQFTTQVDIAKRPPSRYIRKLPNAPSNPNGRDNDDADAGFGFGDSP